MGSLDKFKIIPGCTVMFQGGVFQIRRVLDLKTLLLEPNNGVGNFVRATIADVTPIDEIERPVKPNQELQSITEESWQVAQQRYAIIRPILAGEVTTDEVKMIAKGQKVHISTIYRWIERYKQTGKMSSLTPLKKDGGRGKSRLNEDVEAIIKSSIEATYLNKQRKSIQRTIEEVEIHCKNNGLTPPHPNTIRARIQSISAEEKVKQRYGSSIAKLSFEPYVRKYDQANFPLSVVQIDHTKVDIILVDELYRKPLGRPWITLAIDVFSRMVLGFYVSFDPPGAVGTGMCLANSILPKEMMLAKYDINGEWPCWGVMKTIHADNAKEFRGNMLRKAAEEYGINLEWRPVKQPNWGGHIERLLGTLLKEIHNLPGTTFSNTTERHNYNSEKNATLTLKEFENWLTTFIVNVYHNRLHDGIGTTPLAKYNEGIFGSAVQVGCGLPERIFNEKKLHLDFLPYVERSIQQYGVQIDHIQYYHDVLRKWINSLEVSKGKSRIRRKFIFKRDPRDISIVFFYDPELNEYFEIPYRNTSHPAITIWEYREIEKILLEQGKRHIDENAIFEGYQRLRDIEANAIGKKREAQRHKKNCKREHSLSNSFLKRTSPLTVDESTQKEQAKSIPVEIKPFDDLDTSI